MRYYENVADREYQEVFCQPVHIGEPVNNIGESSSYYVNLDKFENRAPLNLCCGAKIGIDSGIIESLIGVSPQD